MKMIQIATRQSNNYSFMESMGGGGVRLTWCHCKTPRRRIKLSSNKKWFDKECRLKRHELRKLANKKHRDPLNPIIREQYHDTLMQYKKLLISKKIKYYNAKISELEKTADNSDATTFWT